jgi:hypothetical protein
MVHASSAHTKLDVYRQRRPQDSANYSCVEDCFETFEQVYQERFEQKYGLRLVEPTPRRKTLARGTCPP